MNKQNTKKSLLLIGITLVVLLLLSVGYDLTFNAGRITYPMDYANYTFRLNDLPLMLSVLLISIYIIVLFAVLIIKSIQKQQKQQQLNRTRKMNAKLGYLGFLGFLGCLGFWTYPVDATIFPFCFFSFFGFFSFFIEGKMSDLLIDERYRQNMQVAQLKALKIGFSIIFITVIILSQGRFFNSLDLIAVILTIVLSLDFALTLFLSEYFLYRLDQEEVE